MAIVDQGQLSYGAWLDAGAATAGIVIGRHDEEFLRSMASDEWWHMRRDLARAELARREALEA